MSARPLPLLLSRRHRGNTSLVALAFLLTLVVFWDRGRVTTAEAEDRKYQLLDAWRPDDITRLDMSFGDRRVVVEAEREEGVLVRYRLIEGGKEVEADEQAIEQYLASLELGMYQRRVEGLGDAEMGLDAPRATISLAMGELGYALRIGGDAPKPDGGAYLEVKGGTRGTVHYVIGAPLLGELLLEPGALRTRRLTPYLSPEVRAYVLDDAGLRVERGGWGGRTAGQFAVTSPAPKTRADRRWLDGWLIQVGRLQVERFVPVPAAPPSDARHLVITPLDEQAEPAELVFGGEGCGPGTILVTRRAPSPDAGCVPAETADAVLGLSAERLRDQHVVGTAKDDIVEILWRAPDGPEVELARIESGWNMRKPVAGPAESEPVAELLDRMIELEGSFADGEPDLEALGLAPPRAEVVLRGLPERGVEEADQREERIEVGAARDGQVALRRVDDGRILFVSEEDGRFFLPRPSALRSTQILEVSLAAVRGLRLDCKGRKQHVTRLPAGSWTLEEPKTSLSVDVGSVGAITENLRQLKALRWIAERPAPAHELDEPWCKVTLESEEGGEKRRHTLLLGAPTQGGYFAKQSDAPAVFVAPKGLGAAAQEWLVSRSWLMTDEATIRKVTLLGRDGARREVERRGGAWSDRALGRTVEAVLGQLLAEAVLSLGRGPEKGFDDPTLRITIETDDGERRELVVGRGEVWKNTSVFLVRDDRVDATFAVAKSRLELLLDAL